jgi:hypothetical protein
MGFEFIRTERLLNVDESKTRYGDLKYNNATGLLQTSATPAISSADKVLPAWVQSGLLLAKGQDIVTRITERDDKSYSVQPFCSMSIGATRMEEDKCLEIIVGQ